MFCEADCLHVDTVARVRQGLSGDAAIGDTAELFKALSDPTRLKIVNALLLAEICVCDVAALLSMSQPAVSHHLKVLRAARLVRTRREGKTVFYTLDDEHVANIFYQGLIHVSHK
ncbi:MAG: metalloregulator ArsR/SmtB family transcription factor [Clostridiales Family XIII bacterium]|nr:metalloregulator ArsR/SmtB family transcription factor [Clostridiales Family XIII bacterium]